MSRTEQAAVVSIFQEYIPDYREAFFEELIRLGRSKGIQIKIYAGRPSGLQAKRLDQVTPDWVHTIKVREFRFFGLRLNLSVPMALWRRADLLVFEQARRNLALYLALAIKPKKVALWGHGADRLGFASDLTSRLMMWATKKSSWFFSYTQEGAEFLVKSGYPHAKISVLNNANDTSKFRQELHQARVSRAKTVSVRHGTNPSIGLFVGGLDSHKRITFLVEAADCVRDKIPNFELRIVGEGALTTWLNKAALTRPWLKILGRLTGAQLAQQFLDAKLLMIPGRVGLVAVDSIVSGVPIVSTNRNDHAPECSYLSSSTALFTGDSVREYAEGVVSLLLDQHSLAKMATNCAATQLDLSSESMAARFLQGIEHAIATPKENSA